MTERQREWLSWLVLFGLVCLVGYLATQLAGPVVYWVATCLLEIFDWLHLPPIFSMLVSNGMRYLMIAVKFGALGFAYCVLMELPWRKAALLACALGVALEKISMLWSSGPQMLPAMLASVGFYADTTVACAASFLGAWQAHRNRHHPHLEAVRDGVFRAVGLGG